MNLKKTRILSGMVDSWRLSSHEDLLQTLVELETGSSKTLAQMTEEEVDAELRDNVALYSDLGCECGLQQGTEHEGYHHPECPDWDGHNG